ncbi:MAG: glycosyltransferase family 1 protein [Pyrinomonadaceae bacterium]
MTETTDITEQSETEHKNARVLPETLRALERISWNYWWSWASDGAALFRDLDSEIWDECEHNPRRVLQEINEFRLMKMATDPIYIARVENLAAHFDKYMNDDAVMWAKANAATITHEHPIAYFCAEFGIHNSLPLYSGGLGMLAGDHLKSSSDLGVPMVAVGLLYNHGYFRQRLRRDGWQEEQYREVNQSDLPIHLVRDAETQKAVKVELEMRGRRVVAQAWRVDVGRVKLYLLDTNIQENELIDRLITGHLYGGDRETRCVQEMVLGVGGIRLLKRLHIEPSAFHLNEGHSAFLTLELARNYVEQGKSFDEAANLVRELCVFTTHTPVAAGHDEFLPSLVSYCFGGEYLESLKIPFEEFLNLGRVNAGNEEELFGLTPLALRMCRSTNGVSRKHGEVSRALWQPMFPDKSIDDVPITSVTNGVHAPTWVAPLLASLYDKYIGEDWNDMQRDAARWAEGVAKIPDEDIWRVHCLLKQRLVAFIRERLYHARVQQHEARDYAEMARKMFDPDALTIGFARRIAAYKRWSLILTDPERLLNLINNAERPVQFVFAGKAHPQDQGAKLILQQLAQWKLDPRVMQRAVFIQDYDQEIARNLVQAVDVWMNVPRRPLEASGTSGEKVALNGGLNFSVLDGWWIEGYDGRNGFAIGEIDEEQTAATEHLVSEEDASDAESLYQMLETQVVPTYYERDAQGIPRRWVEMMKYSIATLAPAFNSDRMVREYVERIYLKR